ncbi:Cof-type HAD-IIB family hydrolase [Tetragenococcus koreensis]|uniref:Haloacid dehalogenase n=1 Tax=Tetragenococcus koreensis TaxID=290335 RepID=A0AAN4RLK0_9ENTE|nr:Cof-type HAD-IIB family hydrolase [Tetragenococcus koreensis]AYW45653.1 Cof-type HAD-IIB family hydrolase [Tetragenococcus koreensis]MCF1584828.1 Cof-type HAD-IIB family hydrolase [Tetragenococcus koreensis]MCF1614424.1 Cof-type HAD-IIB family hydrolase [Tetragenococcus koreensis]MCF1617959.1 Cof-type HAD-IIB family hydrolase [Tetragenococcus koreensis]MCF1619920.1 Cof-type HAD-IIB family hydrolase [Tetragenococcus koreensis]
MEKRLLLTDLDGTLVKDSKRVAKEDKDFFASIKQNLQVGIATGRSVKEIDYIEEQIQLPVDVKVGFNGGLVTIEGKIIQEKFIETDVLEQLLRYIETNNLVYDALDGTSRIGTYQSEEKGRIWNVKLVNPKDPFATIMPKKIYKINIRPEENRCDSVLEQIQKEFPQLSMCKSNSTRIEITPPNVTKGKAVDILRKEEAKIITVGDSENDISMFQASDQSFCLSHASQEVQDQADIIIDNFHEVGLYIS